MWNVASSKRKIYIKWFLKRKVLSSITIVLVKTKIVKIKPRFVFFGIEPPLFDMVDNFLSKKI